MNKKALIPSGISALRLAALPIFLYFFSNSAISLCFLVYGVAQATDLIDGYVARKLKIASKFGAYFDAITDFVFITGIFTAFTLSGYYPAWVLLLITASFGQFIASSLYTKKLYDPFGKYIGSVLYIAIGLTLLFPNESIFIFVQYTFGGFFFVSLGSRILSLTKKKSMGTGYFLRQTTKVTAIAATNTSSEIPIAINATEPVLG